MTLRGAITSSLVMLFLGCSSERPTRSESQEFRVIDLDDPVTYSSIYLVDSTSEDDYGPQEKTFILPDSAGGRVTEDHLLWISGLMPEKCLGSHVEYFDEARNDWKTVIQIDSCRDCGCLWYPEPFSILLTRGGNDPTATFLVNKRTLRIRGAWSLDIGFVDFIPSYDAVWHPPNQAVSAMAHDGEFLWMAVRDDTSFRESKLLLVDKAGRVSGESQIAAPYVWAMTSDGDVIWVMYGASEGTVGALNEDGTVSNLFEYVSGPFQQPYAMAWAEGRLWFIRRLWLGDHSEFSLAGVDIAKSTQAGTQVIDSIIPLDGLQNPPMSMTWDGQALLLTGNNNFTRVDLEGNVSVKNPYQENWSFLHSKTAYDGSTLWMSHAGPIEFAALPERVSRFQPRQDQ